MLRSQLLPSVSHAQPEHLKKAPYSRINPDNCMCAVSLGLPRAACAFAPAGGHAAERTRLCSSYVSTTLVWCLQEIRAARRCFPALHQVAMQGAVRAVLQRVSPALAALDPGGPRACNDLVKERDAARGAGDEAAVLQGTSPALAALDSGVLQGGNDLGVLGAATGNGAKALRTGLASRIPKDPALAGNKDGKALNFTSLNLQLQTICSMFHSSV